MAPCASNKLTFLLVRDLVQIAAPSSALDHSEFTFNRYDQAKIVTGNIKSLQKKVFEGSRFASTAASTFDSLPVPLPISGLGSRCGLNA